MTTIDEKYNGWANYETWNVALWLANDEGLYRLAIASNATLYSDLVAYMADYGVASTPDGVRYDDPKVNADEMHNFLVELLED